LLWALKYTDFDIFQSEYIRNVFRNAGYKKTNNKVIHNGVNQELFNMSGKKFWDGSYPLKIFSNAFAIRESKRFDIIAEFSELTNVEVYHVGVWPENLNSRKAKLLGKMPQSDFVSLYKEQANIFLHPAEKDICPNAVLEAISCGLPVIYRNPGGTSEIVGNCGVEMKNSSKEALEEILAKFADCVENIKCRHSEFSIESSAKKYIEVFRKLLENNDLS
ncbi:MAG: glycosyltransferase, partial [Candidatus Nanoarchaeia archaeon]